MWYMGLAYDVKGLQEVLAKLPETATVSLEAVEGLCGNVEVWYDKDKNDVVLK